MISLLTSRDKKGKQFNAAPGNKKINRWNANPSSSKIKGNEEKGSPVQMNSDTLLSRPLFTDTVWNSFLSVFGYMVARCGTARPHREF